MSNTREANTLRAKPLTEAQRQIIAGCLLGDGTLSWSGHHHRVRIEHEAKQKVYVDWKFSKFKSHCLSNPQYVPRHQSWRFGAVGLPELSLWRTEWFPQSKKEFPESWIEKIEPIALAIWFMDDGNKIHRTISFSVHGFSQPSVDRLERVLALWRIKTSRQWDGHGTRLYVLTESYPTFEGLVKPVVDEAPTMAYKLVQPRRDYTWAPVKAG